jgi:hypothetical protein
MRGPNSLPGWVLADEEPPSPPILTVPCPCCRGNGHDGRSCKTLGLVLLKVMSAGLAGGDYRNGWINQGDEAFNTPGCVRCGDSGVVPCNPDTEEVL